MSDEPRDMLAPDADTGETSNTEDTNPFSALADEANTSSQEKGEEKDEEKGEDVLGFDKKDEGDKDAGDKKDASDKKDGDKKDGDKKDASDKKDGDKKDSDKKEGAPEAYDIQVPEGFQELDKDALAEFEPLARELDLTNEEANKFVSMHARYLQKQQEHFSSEWAKTRDEWREQTRSDKEIGGEKLQENIQKANAFLRKFGTPELFQVFNEYGWGLHPELVRVFARAGAATAEDTLDRGTPPGGDTGKSAAQTLYPTMK